MTITLFKSLFRFFIPPARDVLLCFTGVVELTWPQQIVLGILTVAVVIWLDRSSSSVSGAPSRSFSSPVFSTFRYGYWRFATTAKYFAEPGSVWTALDGLFIVLLLFAETYAFVTLFLGYMQTLWPLRRTPVPLPDDTDQWPAIDLLIPTYNEPHQRR